MPEQVSYFARRNASGRIEIIRHLPSGRTESFGTTGTWQPVELPASTDYPAARPIAAENAALKIYQRRERGVVPKVEGVRHARAWAEACSRQPGIWCQNGTFES